MHVVAAAHPGKMGDTLYCLPLLRFLYGQNGWHFDFYTSQYCAPLRELFEHQPYIRSFNISESYELRSMDMGCQPPDVPIPVGYDTILQLGFRRTPDSALHQFIAKEAGVNVPLAVTYDYPILGSPCGKPYICIAPRGNTSYRDLFNDVARELGVRGFNTAIIGGRGEQTLDEHTGLMDLTGTSLLETLSLLHHSRGFVGLMSSQLVLANGIDIPKIVPHDGRSWDMRHVVEQHWNHYPVNPSAQDVLGLLHV